MLKCISDAFLQSEAHRAAVVSTFEVNVDSQKCREKESSMFLICFDHHSKIRCISELTVLHASWKASFCCRDNLSIASANSNVCCLLKRSGDAFLIESLEFFSWRPDALEFVRSKVRAPRTFLRRSSTSWRRSLGPYLPWSGSTQT